MTDIVVALLVGAETFSNDSTLISSCGPANNEVLCCGIGDEISDCCSNQDGFQWDNATIVAGGYRDTSSSTIASSTIVSSVVTMSSATTASSPTAAASLAANNTTTEGEKTCSSRTGLGVGLGVGLGLPLILVSSALVLLLAQRRRQASERPNPAAQTRYSPRPGPETPVNKDMSRPNHPAEL